MELDAVAGFIDGLVISSLSDPWTSRSGVYQAGGKLGFLPTCPSPSAAAGEDPAMPSRAIRGVCGFIKDVSVAASW